MASKASGVVVAGHGVASGRSGDARFPAGTITLQIPIFHDRGVSLAGMLGAEPLLGTINLDIRPLTPQVIVPEIRLDDVAWSNAAPAENFWLFRAILAVAGFDHRAII